MPVRRRIAILGAGPIGLEAALYGLACGFGVRVYERGPVAANVASWGHVRMFTNWSSSTTSLGLRLLDEHGLDPPDPAAYPTGHDLLHEYLVPIATSPRLAGRVLTDTRVVFVARESQLKVSNFGRPKDRALTPFRLLVHDGAQARIEHADVVIDATGTYGQPAGFGAGGLDPVDAPHLRTHIDRFVLDVFGMARDRYSGKHVLLVGSGPSAATQAVALAELATGAPGTRVTWVTRSDEADPIALQGNDALSARRTVCETANRLAADARSPITHIASAAVSTLVTAAKNRLNVGLVHGDGSSSTVPAVDVILALVGYRPDLDLDTELQVQRCYATEAPLPLATRILGERGTRTAFAGGGRPILGLGRDVMLQPEPGYFIAGAKSYGRLSHFLLPAGHEQIRDIFQHITGDAALDLYATA